MPSIVVYIHLPFYFVYYSYYSYYGVGVKCHTEPVDLMFTSSIRPRGLPTAVVAG